MVSVPKPFGFWKFLGGDSVPYLGKTVLCLGEDRERFPPFLLLTGKTPPFFV